ncbi:MAG: hypothetical protein LBQ79_00970 [Deltaproteobacteria bacterium]|nr:hypothetical protein [Deltaproteobacteria bacterium]
MIVSSIPGRIRLRSENFKDPDLALDELAECPGIVSWEMNTLTGSLLVNYDPMTVSPVRALQILDSLDPGALRQYAEYLERTGTDPEEMLASWKRKPAVVAPGGDRPPSASAASGELWSEVVGFAVSIGALTLSGFLGIRKIHVVAGMFFLELAAKHAWRYRKRIRAPRATKLGDFLLPGSGDGAPGTPELPAGEDGAGYLC